jgi:uncharacterized protein RhaS with RHS repeats
MFDPNLGRWMQLDPIGFDSGDVNLYRFADNTPVVETDPLGLKKYESKDGPFGKMTVEIRATRQFTVGKTHAKGLVSRIETE